MASIRPQSSHVSTSRPSSTQIKANIPSFSADYRSSTSACAYESDSDKDESFMVLKESPPPQSRSQTNIFGAQAKQNANMAEARSTSGAGFKKIEVPVPVNRSSMARSAAASVTSDKGLKEGNIIEPELSIDLEEFRKEIKSHLIEQAVTPDKLTR